MADAPQDAPAAETRDCKYCSRSLGCDSYVLKQWQKPGPPCCIACAAERSAAGDEAASRGEQTAALANEPTALRAQVEFYLSDKNLRRDAFYRSRIEACDGGWLCGVLMRSWAAGGDVRDGNCCLHARGATVQLMSLVRG